eukprot:scaffold7717_cov34-Prasinocladus_malaysianus.AAC.1
MRNPLTRVQSAWHYTGRHSTPLCEYSGTRGTWSMPNYQTLMLAGALPLKGANMTPDYVPDTSSDILLVRAKHNLDKHFDFVGIMEYMKASLQLLCKRFGKDPSVCQRGMAFHDKQTAQKVKKTHPASEADLDCVARNNLLDLQLYDYAYHKLFREYARLPEDKIQPPPTTIKNDETS